ncbi:unnamed protein product [Protopolystoma xenopodis]|uniref:Uncharacterized protein n=1 Tax=Protopolystoma xenopodis TaxID=117903 RepID=A0A3S5CMD6_9PLAT|nr:unnamed protein product [Protopolystoma xenopodis]
MDLMTVVRFPSSSRMNLTPTSHLPTLLPEPGRPVLSQSQLPTARSSHLHRPSAYQAVFHPNRPVVQSQKHALTPAETKYYLPKGLPVLPILSSAWATTANVTVARPV